MKPFRDRPSALLRLLYGLCALLLVASALGLGYPSSPSVPRGLYLRSSLPEPLSGGTVVLFCLPTLDGLTERYVHPRAWNPCPGNLPLTAKPLLGVPGDWIELQPEGVRHNHGPLLPGSAVLLADRLGRSQPHFPYGLHQLGKDEFWVQSKHPRGFDSRVYGPVSRAQIRYRWLKLL